MPTLLQINSVVNTGSTGRIAEQLGQFALSKGWRSYIAYGRRSNTSTSKTIRIGSKLDLTLHGIKSMVFDKHGLGSVNATQKFLQCISEVKPSLIHLHNLHGYYLNYKILFAYLLKANIPVVWTLHDCWSITGHCSYFSDINCIRFKTECYDCPKRKNYPASLFFDRSSNNYQFKRHLFTSIDNMTIVPVSIWLGGRVQESYLANYPMHVINNGIDINAFYPQSNSLEIRKKYGIGEKFMLLGVATSWSASKGLDDYSKLSQTISDEYTIVLLGLSKKQRRLLPNNVIGLGRTESIKELAELYSTANIVLNLSYQEAFGMTTVEGFACGTPGIVYNCTASPELITPETGLIVEPGNIGQLHKAIELIRFNGKDYYSASCRKQAEIYYNKQNQFNEYMKLYTNLLKNYSEGKTHQN